MSCALGNAIASTDLIAPAADGARFLNGGTFAATATPDVARIEIYAGNERLGTLTAANGWQLPYTFGKLGAQKIVVKSYDAAYSLLDTIHTSIEVVEIDPQALTANGIYINGTPLELAASAKAARVVLRVSGYEVARSLQRNANGQFTLKPAALATTGKTKFVFEAYGSDGALIEAQTLSVDVQNLQFASPGKNSSHSVGKPISLSVKAAAGTASVQYFADDQLVATSRDSESDFAQEIRLSRAGDHTLKAVSYSAFGTPLQAVTLSVSTTPGAFAANLQAALDGVWRKTGLPGVSVSVLTPNIGMVYAQKGIASVNTPTPVVPNQTRYRIASATKTFTATMVMLLQEKGYLNIDDKLSLHLTVGGLPNANVITIRQLLNHSSAVGDYLNESPTFTSAAVPGRIFSDADIVGYINALAPKFIPGTQYYYSNGGYYLLGMLIEKKLNLPLDMAMKSWIFTPLGLNSTYLDLSSSASNPITDLAASARAYAYSTTSVRAAGAIVSTSADLARFNKALFGGTLLTKPSIAAMEAASANSTAYGLGTRINKATDGTVYYGHTGTLLNYNAMMYYIPSMNVTVGINTNDYGGNYWLNIRDAVYNAVATEYAGFCLQSVCP